MTLIEMVRKARELNLNWIAVDEDCRAFAYPVEPYKQEDGWNFDGSNYKNLGHFNLTCDWQDSLIDITKLRGIK